MLTSSAKTILLLSFWCCANVVAYFNDVQLTKPIYLRDVLVIRGVNKSLYQSFLGIPYAEPPVGQLRFLNPVPKKRIEYLIANTEAEMCMDIYLLGELRRDRGEGSEDCLYLNIFRPNINYDANPPLDVMVYIHNEGYLTGPLNTMDIGPEYFMKEESVILVMVQYRLSVLGFLSTGDDECPGNYGLKDQALALKWVKKNIEGFGGNPDSITIFGHGSGAASVHMHMLSPLSRNSFNKAIAVSGNAIGPKNYPTKNTIEIVRKLAKVVGIEDVDSLSNRHLVQGLREFSAKTLMQSVANFAYSALDWWEYYRAVVEPKSVIGAFLTEDPEEMLKRGDFAKVPFMTGVVHVEGELKSAANMNEIQFNLRNMRMDELLLMVLATDTDAYRNNTLKTELKGRYLNALNVIKDYKRNNSMQVYMDYSFYYPFYKTLRYMSNSIPVYPYKFSYKGQHSYSAYYPKVLDGFKLEHWDDDIYLFDSPANFKEGLNENDQMASEKLVRTFIAFAKYENPPKHNLQMCNARDMKPMCKYTEFFKNESGQIDTRITNQLDAEMIKFWDKVSGHVPFINLQDGTSVRGLWGDTYQSFLGIPYAEPPLGHLRFANPTPRRSYKTIYADKNPEMCIQRKFILVPSSTLVGSEDCLYLNIYRPNVEYNYFTKLDVMVYIHGGGFFYGSIQPNLTGPTYFMEEKSVILVMVQYRLSVLGFLSTGDRESPGNFGLKDQAMALKWIKDNIKEFGGNPDSITIFGHGTGAASVHMHMLSPLSVELFNKAIAMSGIAIAPYNYPTRNPIELARRQAKIVGVEDVDSLNSRELVRKLREVNADELIRSVDELKIFDVNPLTLYRTVVEPNIKGAFLIEDPETMLRKGNFANVPFMTGTVEEEAAVIAVRGIINFETLLNELNSDLDNLLPRLLEMNVDDYKIPIVMRRIKDEYLGGLNVINDTNKYYFIKINSDYSFNYPLYKTLLYMTNSIPVYLYKFSYRGLQSFSEYYTTRYIDYGVVHGDDLFYLFDSPAILPEGLHENDRIASRKLIQTLTAFANNENPPKHILPKCNLNVMKVECKFLQFYENSSRLIDTHEDIYEKLVNVIFWDELSKLTIYPKVIHRNDDQLKDITHRLDTLLKKKERK